MTAILEVAVRHSPAIARTLLHCLAQTSGHDDAAWWSAARDSFGNGVASTATERFLTSVRGFVDLVMHSPDGHELWLEVKVDAPEGPGQLAKYQAAAEDREPEASRRARVGFLTRPGVAAPTAVPHATWNDLGEALRTTSTSCEPDSVDRYLCGQLELHLVELGLLDPTPSQREVLFPEKGWPGSLPPLQGVVDAVGSKLREAGYTLSPDSKKSSRLRGGMDHYHSIWDHPVSAQGRWWFTVKIVRPKDGAALAGPVAFAGISSKGGRLPPEVEARLASLTADGAVDRREADGDTPGDEQRRSHRAIREFLYEGGESSESAEDLIAEWMIESLEQIRQALDE